jgi:tetratricopeptide (TPR) repeat protein
LKSVYVLSGVAFAAFLSLAMPAQSEFSLTENDSLSGNYLAGRSAGHERDNAVAADYLSRALLLDPNNPALTEKLFQLEVAAGDIQSAEELAIKVLGFNSQQRLARIVLGLRDLRNKHYPQARKNFDQAAYTPVGELTSALLNAWAFAGEGNLPSALKELDKLDTNESFANFKTYHAALIADLLNNPVRAEEAYKKAYQQGNASLRIVQSYGNFLERHNRKDEAIKIYQSFLDGGDDNPLVRAALAAAKSGQAAQPFIGSVEAGASEAMFSMASAMTDEQSIDVAILYTQLSLSLHGDKPVVYTLLGDVYEQAKLYNDAIKAYDQTPASSPLRNNSDTQIAVDLQQLNKTKDAQDKLNAVITRDPTNYAALVTLGNIHRNNEEYQQAADIYTRTIALFPQPGKDQWRLFYYRGMSYERLKQWDKAEPDFRKALSLSPDEPVVLNYLGYSMIEKKINLTEALAMVKKAVELKPNDGYIVDSLGWAYYQLGDYEQATTQMERAVDLNPADPIIGEHLGDAYWQVGRRLEAKFQWQHAKDNKPLPEDLKRIEDKLKNGMPDTPSATPSATQPVDPMSGNSKG